MEEINHESDLHIEFNFKDSNKEVTSIPNYDFKIEYRTDFCQNRAVIGRVITASQIDGVLTNCSIDGDLLDIYFDKPALRKGRLWRKITYFKPNNTFPDGIQTIVEDKPTNITVV